MENTTLKFVSMDKLPVYLQSFFKSMGSLPDTYAWYTQIIVCNRFKKLSIFWTWGGAYIANSNLS